MISCINGERIFFDIGGPALVEHGATMKTLPAVVVLHGSYVDHSYLKSPLLALNDACQPVFLDYRGSGRSGRSRPDTWNLGQLAQDVMALLDLLGLEHVVLLGHSWGCHVAGMCNRLAPGRVLGNILLNPVFFDLPSWLVLLETRAGVQAAGLANAILVERDASAMDEYLSLAAPLLFRKPPSPELFARMLPSPEFFMNSIDELLEIDMEHLCSTLCGPNLVVYGRHDPYLNDGARASLAKLGARPGFNVVELPEAGHFVLNENEANVLHRVSEFLTRTIR